MKNKIEVDSIKLNNEYATIDNKNISYIEANGQCQINLFNCNIINLKIYILDNSELTINYFSLIDNPNTNIIINVNNQSSLIMNHSFINRKEYNLNIQTDFMNEESKIQININGINDSGKLNIDVDGYVKTNKINNYLDENIHILNFNDGYVRSNPNMYIDTSKVIANHNTTIGNINNDELFYLCSKCLDKESASKIISQGFLIKIISNEELKNKIKDFE